MSNTASDIAYFIPAKYRKGIYTALFYAGILLGAVTVGFATAGAGVPTAVLVAGSVLGYIGSAVGYVAKANTPSETPQD